MLALLSRVSPALHPQPQWAKANRELSQGVGGARQLLVRMGNPLGVGWDKFSATGPKLRPAVCVARCGVACGDGDACGSEDVQESYDHS